MVLLVEDHTTLRTILAESIESLGYRVIAVGTGLDALDAYASQTVDAVLLDVNLPDMNGLELVRRLHSVAGRQPIPVIGLSGHGGASHRRRCLDAGMVAYLTKPVGLQNLADVIEKCLTKRS